MTKRAYSPRLSTIHLMADILRQDGVAKVRTIAPIHSAWTSRPAMLRITLDSGSYSDFTLADARKWLDTPTEVALRG